MKKLIRRSQLWTLAASACMAAVWLLPGVSSKRIFADTPAAGPTPDFLVTNTNDNGTGSLRQAVLSANAAAGAQIIGFDPSIFNVPRTITLTSGEVATAAATNGSVTINGPGAQLLTISGNNSSRIFHFLGSQTRVSAMRLIGGNGVGAASNGNGGAILNNGQMTLDDVEVVGNSAAIDGGGIFSTSGVTMNRCLISENTANSDSNTTGDGGGVMAFNIGQLTFNNSVVSNNEVRGNTRFGGGVGVGGNNSSTNAFAQFFDSTVTGNRSAFGGGIATGIGTNGRGSINVVRSTISNNQALVSNGGGIWGANGAITLENSTVSGNSAVGNGGGIFRTGISAFSNPGQITSTTISNNTSTGSGGGLHNATGSTVMPMRGSIVANNVGSAAAPDLLGATSSGGFNLIEDTTGATFSGDTATNITGVDPNLGPLQNNGGPTLTHLPNAGSPVIDKSAFFNTTEDQRGLARLVDDPTIANAPGGNGSDMGSVEVQGGGGPTPTPTPPASPTPTPSPSPSPGSTPLYTRGDYDGDNNTDLTVWRPSAFAAPNENLSAFYTFRSTDASFFGIQFGNTGDVAIAGDFDGDNKTDFGISRYTSGDGVDLVYLESSTNTTKFPVWGIAGDIFVSGDYDGDKKTDVMAWRPSDGTWYIVNSSGSNGGYTFIQHGQAGDKPYAMDTDGDGKSNLAYYRPSMGRWVIKDAVGPGITGVNFGTASDVPVPADYDGDNKDDIAVFRDGLWIIRPSTNVIDVQFIPFGSTGDVPVPGDYDGDNLYDQAVYRQGIWHMLRSSQGYTGFQFGAPTDTAMPKAYIP